MKGAGWLHPTHSHYITASPGNTEAQEGAPSLPSSGNTGNTGMQGDAPPLARGNIHRLQTLPPPCLFPLTGTTWNHGKHLLSLPQRGPRNKRSTFVRIGIVPISAGSTPPCEPVGSEGGWRETRMAGGLIQLRRWHSYSRLLSKSRAHGMCAHVYVCMCVCVYVCMCVCVYVCMCVCVYCVYVELGD